MRFSSIKAEYSRYKSKVYHNSEIISVRPCSGRRDDKYVDVDVDIKSTRKNKIEIWKRLIYASEVFYKFDFIDRFVRTVIYHDEETFGFSEYAIRGQKHLIWWLSISTKSIP